MTSANVVPSQIHGVREYIDGRWVEVVASVRACHFGKGVRPREAGHKMTQPKRTQGRELSGTNGYRIMDNGNVYDPSGHKLLRTGKHLHLVNPGKDYGGPVPPAFGNTFGRYLTDGYDTRDPHDHDRSKRAPTTTCYDRRLAELVAYEFLGPPPTRSAIVAHIDGDRSNCAANNLAYVLDAEAERYFAEQELMALMRPGRRSSGVIYTDKKPLKKREGADLNRNPTYLPDRYNHVQPPPTRVPHWDAEYPQAS